MISFTCPGCQSTFRLADELAGKSARCSKCNQRFTVPAAAAKPVVAPPAQSAPAPRPAAAPKPAVPPPAPVKKVALNPVPEIMEAEIVDEPVTASLAPSAKAPVAFDDVEVVDDGAIQEAGRVTRPVRSRDDDDEDHPRRGSRRGDDDWDEGSDENRPRRRRPARRSGGGSGVLMACIGGGSFVLMFLFLILMIVTAPQPVIAVNAGPQNFGPGIQFADPGGVQPNNPEPNPAAPNPANPNPAPAVGNPGPGIPLNLVNGFVEIQGDLRPADPLDKGGGLPRPGSRAKRYNVALEANKTYTIELLRMGRFDPYLRLELNGANLLEDDDGAGNLDSRIVIRPQQAGTYTVIATSLGQGFGAFRLRVRGVP